MRIDATYDAPLLAFVTGSPVRPDRRFNLLCSAEGRTASYDQTRDLAGPLRCSLRGLHFRHLRRDHRWLFRPSGWTSACFAVLAPLCAIAMAASRADAKSHAQPEDAPVAA